MAAGPQGQGAQAWSGPVPPSSGQAVLAPVLLNALVFLCVLVTFETSTLDSVATGFVSSHTEFWAARLRCGQVSPAAGGAPWEAVGAPLSDTV